MAMKRMALAAMGLALLVALTGCGSAAMVGATAVPKRVAEAAQGFVETDKSGGIAITLAVEPLKIGDNQIMVTFDDKSVQAAEAQVIMASMGHGAVTDLVRSPSGRWEATVPTIDMEGKWLIRVKATLASGEEKQAMFHLSVK
jgi:hypothetical protein